MGLNKSFRRIRSDCNSLFSACSRLCFHYGVVFRSVSMNTIWPKRTFVCLGEPSLISRFMFSCSIVRKDYTMPVQMSIFRKSTSFNLMASMVTPLSPMDTYLKKATK